MIDTFIAKSCFELFAVCRAIFFYGLDHIVHIWLRHLCLVGKSSNRRLVAFLLASIPEEASEVRKV
ncbi:hypothetical protein BXO8_15800 [Xanthomonas oryzae pv. oryzae]|nr:hypothetical protein AZ54_10965 [Xanthomonas oryzae pv. oryzae PXO86]ALZ72090.1 hypothetical protein APZ20_11910 [Xanthomonas oryzae pv. oryzae]AOS06189.1 hypothetical protein ATY43_08920 [Xanthomonas oryzae pv. oryzae]OLG45584.1 hypothetical protein BXO8_15800 [Xanthomonas oryzae pv. oryzae]OLH14775.1 hypothetical protein DXO015_12175 [Xanthomonas oryzae pv. oryzae]